MYNRGGLHGDPKCETCEGRGAGNFRGYASGKVAGAGAPFLLQNEVTIAAGDAVTLPGRSADRGYFNLDLLSSSYFLIHRMSIAWLDK